MESKNTTKRAGANALAFHGAGDATMSTLYKSVETLRGSVLFTYTASILSVLGLLSPEAPVFQKRTLTRFYGSDAVVSHHTSKGNFEQHGGGYRLTAQGRQKFAMRVTGKSAQQVDLDLLPHFIESIKTGKDHAKLGRMFEVK